MIIITEQEKLYQLYLRVQGGDETAINELFTGVESKDISRADSLDREYRMSHMDNMLDSELVLDEEQDRRINSSDSMVKFSFKCLNEMVSSNKRGYSYDGKNTGYRNGVKVKSNGKSKYYDGEYDVSDLGELMFEVVLEIFKAKLDEDNCLTLYGKRNDDMPITDGVSLLKNIAYFTSIAMNKRAEKSYLDTSETGYYSGYDDDDSDKSYSKFDYIAEKEYLEMDGKSARLPIYAECLEWLRNNDIDTLFNVNAYNVRSLIRLFKEQEDIFKRKWASNRECRELVTQEELCDKLAKRYGIHMKQENISANMKIIEQRLLDHLLYSLNYYIGKPEKLSKEEMIYNRESQRALCAYPQKRYNKIFHPTISFLYAKSRQYIDRQIAKEDYLTILLKEEDIVLPLISSHKGKDKYDMINILMTDKDSVSDDQTAFTNIASMILAYVDKRETDYMDAICLQEGYRVETPVQTDTGCWDARLKEENLRLKFLKDSTSTHPSCKYWEKENLIVYWGCINIYFCNTEKKLCYKLPKHKRVFSKQNKYHENFICNIA